MSIRVPTLLGEEWKALPEHSGYQISNLGRVIGPRGHLLSLIDSGRGGYLAFNVWVNQKNKVFLLHLTVCRLFNGEPPVGKTQALHNNHVLHDCRASNLHWGSQKDNMREMYAANRSAAKLTFPQAEEIRRKNKSGVPQKDLCTEYGVSPAVISNIVNFKTWKVAA